MLMRRAAIQEEAFYTTPVFRTAVSGDVDTFLSGLQLISHSSSRDLIFMLCCITSKRLSEELGRRESSLFLATV
jgi:hypothetical protein